MKEKEVITAVRKKIGIITAVVLTAVLLAAAWFIKKDKQVVVSDPWEAVPSDAFLIAETHDLSGLLERAADPAGVAARLSAMQWAGSVRAAALAADSLTGPDYLREMISGRRAVISFHPAGSGHTTFLAVIGITPPVSHRHLIQIIRKAGGTVEDMRELGGSKTFSVTTGNGPTLRRIYMATAPGLVLLSPSGKLIDDAMSSRASGTDIRKQQGVAPVIAAAGRQGDNLFVLFRNLPPFLQPFLSADMVSRVAGAAVAGGGDLTFRDEGLILSGFLTTAGTGQGADRITKIAPGVKGVHELLPAGTLSYTTVMKKMSLAGDTATDPASINATDIALSLVSLTDGEVTSAIVPAGNGSSHVTVFRMKDTREAEKILRRKLTVKYRSMGLREKHFIAGGDGDGGTVLYKMPFTGVASLMSGEPGQDGDDSWVVFSRSYMIFGSSPQALSELSVESLSDNTLVNDPRYRDMENMLPTRSSFMFYAAGETLDSVVGRRLTPQARERLGSTAFDAIDGIGLSLSPSNGMVYVNLSVRFVGQGERRPAAARKQPTETTPASQATAGDLKWKISLDAPLATRPFLFVNHNTGATEIFVQDEKNNIYLIASSGKILWKARIRERIIGDIFMIDYYRNGKNQLLFAGREYLHIIDRNGNYVDRYPVSLRSPAACGLALFDYENNKDYRLVIAGEDRKIYVYDRTGAPVRGWNLFVTQGKVTSPVRFFRIGGKDYLFVADDRSIYMLDRTGNQRVSIRQQATVSAGSAVRLTGEPGSARITFASADGKVSLVAPDGSVTVMAAQSVTSPAMADFFDITGDGSADYIFAEKSSVTAYSSDGKALFRRDLQGEGLSGLEAVAAGPGAKRLAVFSRGEGMLYLIDRTGSDVPGFPHESGPLFTIGRVSGKSTWNLVTGNAGNELFNYELSGLK